MNKLLKTISAPILAIGLMSQASMVMANDSSGGGYVIPADELGKFMENQETEKFSEDNQEKVERKEGDSAGMHMFKMFRSRIERSGKEFDNLSEKFEDSTKKSDQ